LFFRYDLGHNAGLTWVSLSKTRGITMKATTGYVRQRDRDKRWYCRVSYTDHQTGKRMFITKFGTSEAHARSLLPQLLAEASAKAQGKQPEPPPLDFSSLPGLIPFRKLADEYESHKVDQRQLKLFQRQLKLFTDN
jgi:hypothetical protein